MRQVADFFRMNDRTWERHANPLSGWTRIPILPALCLAIWARVWIGWWCLVPVAVLLVWTWVNPRAFPPPATTDAWMSRGVMGERVWLNRAAVPIPAHHAAWAGVLAWAAGLGLPPLIYGLWALDLGWLVAGLVLTMLPKLWFLDRMAWLYDDMAARHAPYAAWRR